MSKHVAISPKKPRIALLFVSLSRPMLAARIVAMQQGRWLCSSRTPIS